MRESFGVDGIAGPGDEHQRRLRAHGLQSPYDVPPGELGRPNLHEAQIEGLAGEARQRGRPVRAEGEPMPGGPQEIGQDVPHVWVVIDDHNVASHDLNGLIERPRIAENFWPWRGRNTTSRGPYAADPRMWLAGAQ